MIEGWLLDVHENIAHTGMVAWIIDDEGTAHACEVPWRPSLHVHASSRERKRLEHWLMQPEIISRFNISGVHTQKMRLDLEGEDAVEVLEIQLEPFHLFRALAEHIEARGDFHRYTLFSVDAHFVQRFLNEYRCELFSRVTWHPDATMILSSKSYISNGVFPPLRIVRLVVDSGASPLGTVPFAAIEHIRLESVVEPGVAPCVASINDVVLKRTDYLNTRDMLLAFQQAFNMVNPDVVLTYGGDQQVFPWLVEQGRSLDLTFHLGRTSMPLTQSTKARTVHSYGQVLHRHGAFFFEGRLHLDLRNSFIVKEGGVAGLFELAQHSSQSAQVISRLSPGSVISAIQMRVAMDDGVLVPWKKNRPEDTKSALELLHADRGGLYLDSHPGVYSSVIELDFASLFPSIIATRNISPETLNCSCCQVSNNSSVQGIVPLHPSKAFEEFRQRRLRSQFGHGLFPLSHEKALQVPGLSTHTCGRKHGFLGRVVAPIIERRRDLKSQRKRKGDAFDLRQNALKWLLVTCFGYTGYRNARFGRIEAHEAICAWSRDILLTTIEEAQKDGWEVLHAIVDCVWLADRSGRHVHQQKEDAQEFARRITEMIGIPLEFEQQYDFIAFLPSRIHGAGSLTKYWAYGAGEYKVRGIEMRQHSTPLWIVSLQQKALGLLAAQFQEHTLPSMDAQLSVLQFYREEIQQLERGLIPLSDLVITRRVTSSLRDYRVKNLTFSALMRAHHQDLHVPPGGKIRYVVTNLDATEPTQRVLLAEELPHLSTPTFGCKQHYATLAERAIWAILAPFGWSTEDIQRKGRQRTLLEFTSVHQIVQKHPEMQR